MGIEALTTTSNGEIVIPQTKEDWFDWISASKIRNYALNNPLSDWLDLYGNDHGFTRDDKLENYDLRTDFTQFIFRKGREFEDAVVKHIQKTVPVSVLGTDWRRSRSLEAAEETFATMCNGDPVIAQGILRDAENQTYGLADLLVRSDELLKLFPGCMTSEEAQTPAPDIPLSNWHYRVLDIKYSTLNFNADGNLSDTSGSSWAYKLQVYIYNRMLGRLQGFHPPETFLLGRGWKQTRKKENFRGTNCMDRLAVVPMDHTSKSKGSLSSNVDLALSWLRRVRSEGQNWQVLPEPSIPELRPNMKFTEDYPWHNAKQLIASELEDLTLLWNVGLKQRDLAQEIGLARWTDDRASASSLGVTGTIKPRILDSILNVNRPDTTKLVLPELVGGSDDLWRTENPVEFFVDFETVSDLDDSFADIPEKGGLPLIFMIGCGHVENGNWEWRGFTVEHLNESCEAEILDNWFEHMDTVKQRIAPDQIDPLVFHWSPAESSVLKNAFNSAINRHPDENWAEPNWYDFLNLVIKNEPVVVKGSLGFGLKSIAQAMQKHELIDTAWGSSVTDGLGAMVGAWWSSTESESRACSMKDIDLMHEIEKYNEVDCKVMMEVITYLRKHH